MRDFSISTKADAGSTAPVMVMVPAVVQEVAPVMVPEVVPAMAQIVLSVE